MSRYIRDNNNNDCFLDRDVMLFNCFFCFDRVSWHKVCRCFVELSERKEKLGSTNTKASVFHRLQSLVETIVKVDIGKISGVSTKF